MAAGKQRSTLFKLAEVYKLPARPGACGQVGAGYATRPRNCPVFAHAVRPIFPAAMPWFSL